MTPEEKAQKELTKELSLNDAIIRIMEFFKNNPNRVPLFDELIRDTLSVFPNQRQQIINAIKYLEDEKIIEKSAQDNRYSVTGLGIKINADGGWEKYIKKGGAIKWKNINYVGVASLILAALTYFGVRYTHDKDDKGKLNSTQAAQDSLPDASSFGKTEHLRDSTEKQ